MHVFQRSKYIPKYPVHFVFSKHLTARLYSPLELHAVSQIQFHMTRTRRHIARLPYLLSIT